LAAGAKRGDEVVAIDNRPISDVLRDAEERTSGATPQWIRHAALSKLALGVPGSSVVLRLRDPMDTRNSIRDVRLTRAQSPQRIVPPAQSAKIAELRQGVMYVDLGRVTDADVAAAMPRLAAAKGIVFDMRGYPSQVNTPNVLAHLTDSTIRSARFQRPLVMHPDHQRMEFDGDGWFIRPAQPRFHAAVAFLTGGGAISYAESTMGVVEENKLGAIVGQTTAGTNGNINRIILPGGYTVVWTGMRVQKLDGTPHHGVGIRPTVPVAPTIGGIRAGRDEMLERALEIVNRTQP
jgi:C-terminal processing protease CtpA/Prc